MRPVADWNSYGPNVYRRLLAKITRPYSPHSGGRHLFNRSVYLYECKYHAWLPQDSTGSPSVSSGKERETWQKTRYQDNNSALNCVAHSYVVICRNSNEAVESSWKSLRWILGKRQFRLQDTHRHDQEKVPSSPQVIAGTFGQRLAKSEGKAKCNPVNDWVFEKSISDEIEDYLRFLLPSQPEPISVK